MKISPVKFGAVCFYSLAELKHDSVVKELNQKQATCFLGQFQQPRPDFQRRPLTSSDSLRITKAERWKGNTHNVTHQLQGREYDTFIALTGSHNNQLKSFGGKDKEEHTRKYLAEILSDCIYTTV